MQQCLRDPSPDCINTKIPRAPKAQACLTARGILAEIVWTERNLSHGPAPTADGPPARWLCPACAQTPAPVESLISPWCPHVSMHPGWRCAELARQDGRVEGPGRAGCSLSAAFPVPVDTISSCSADLAVQGVTAETRVPQLPRVTRVPPQLPNGAAVYAERVQVCAMYSLAIQTVFPSVAAAA